MVVLFLKCIEFTCNMTCPPRYNLIVIKLGYLSTTITVVLVILTATSFIYQQKELKEVLFFFRRLSISVWSVGFVSLTLRRIVCEGDCVGASQQRKLSSFTPLWHSMWITFHLFVILLQVLVYRLYVCNTEKG